jgi:membrane protease YdiL (CAAX protease family)
MATLIAARPHPHTAGLPALIRRRPLAAYLILAFTAFWLSLLPALSIDAALWVFPFGPLAGILAFALPAFLVTAITDGRAGVRDLLGRALRWRVGLRWYALALLAIPAGIFLIATTFLGVAPLGALADRWPLALTVFLPSVLRAVVTIQIFEELGWTGFVQHRLQDRHGALRASLLVALGFGLIHFPTYFIGVPITGEKVLVVLTQVMPVAIGFGVPFRILITWLYNGSARGVLLAALLHAVFNTVSSTRFAAEFGLGPAGMWLPLAAVAILALLAVVATRGRLGYTRSDTGGLTR